MFAVLVLLYGSTVLAQDAAYIKSWVTRKAVIAEQPFNLFVEASGENLEDPIVPQVEDLFVGTTNPRRQDSVAMRNGKVLSRYSIAYLAEAKRPGTLTIPPISARVDGELLKTEPIEIEVLPAKTPAEPRPKPARLFVDSTEVVVGVPFWIYVQAEGLELKLPRTLEIEGLEIDPTNIQQSKSLEYSRQGSQITEKRGFLARAPRAGPITIPGVPVHVNGERVVTDPLELSVIERRRPPAAAGQTDPNARQLTTDDLILIDMFVDKKEVYQGEPILLTKQLWRIRHDRISTGPHRGQLIQGPSTEGFYVMELEPRTFESTRGPWAYEVHEERRLLFPTAIGSLQVGAWHWEGVALVSKRGFLVREKLHYKLDAGPIDIRVLPLPERPPGFSGAVGTFTVESSLTRDTVPQGTPFSLLITIEGEGNPDAIGAPEIPELEWAFVGAAEPATRLSIPPGGTRPETSKRFQYRITPHAAGSQTVPTVPFTYFDSEAAEFKTASIGPFTVMVQPSESGRSRLVASGELELEGRGVEILAEDIQPLAEPRGPLRIGQPSMTPITALLLAPVMLYGIAALVAVRRRRLAGNSGYARSQRAGPKALRRLASLDRASQPAETLYRVVVDYLAEVFDISATGMTSSDADRLLLEEGIDEHVRRRCIQILRRCERSQYASQKLSRDELRAMREGAESLVASIGQRRKARR